METTRHGGKSILINEGVTDLVIEGKDIGAGVYHAGGWKKGRESMPMRYFRNKMILAFDFQESAIHNMVHRQRLTFLSASDVGLGQYWG